MDKKEVEKFLQSAEWGKFQEAVGRRTFTLEDGGFSASLIEHSLPLVGKYFYCPRGPIIGISNDKFPMTNKIPNPKSKSYLLIDLAKKEKAGWIRIEPENEALMELIEENTKYKIVKAPHDMQPREIFVLDISKSEEQLLAEMKNKTRYNIKLAQKQAVEILAIGDWRLANNKKYINEFIRLIRLTEKRKKVKFHSADYYQKMLETLPESMLKLYVAEYKNKVIAANLMLFYGETAVYLHGATDDEYRNVMAPHLLQWQAILDAKAAGYKAYDFGGVKTSNVERRTSNGWAGITKFKLGFSPNTAPIVFSGSYDIILNPWKYTLYKGLQKIKGLVK